MNYDSYPISILTEYTTHAFKTIHFIYYFLNKRIISIAFKKIIHNFIRTTCYAAIHSKITYYFAFNRGI